MLVSGKVLAENWSGFLLDVDAQGFVFRFPCGQGFWLVRTINFKGTSGRDTTNWGREVEEREVMRLTKRKNRT